MTPDPWTAHSENVALAERIVEVCPGLDADKAYGNTAQFVGSVGDAFSAICCLQIFRFTSSKPSKSAIASDEKFIRLRTNSFVRYCLTCAVCGMTLGVAVMWHSMDGCDDAMAQGWNEAACVCLTHAFPVQDIEADMGRKDIMTKQQRFIDGYLKRLTDDL